jgi:DNA-binding FrmR family transcriptional regulator
MPESEEDAREEIANRLARVAGHAASLKRLWEQDRDSDDMLTQISAVRAGLDQVGRAILAYHIDHRITEAFEEGHPDEAVQELKTALDRFLR